MRNVMRWCITGISAALMLASCGAHGFDASRRLHRGPSTVNVVYAGSLAYINDIVIGPAFQKSTGIHYQGQGGGSFAMARELSSHLISGNVFESVGTAPIQALEPLRTTWAVRVAAAPLVIAFNPKSPDAAYFKKVAAGRVPLKAFFEYLAAHRLHIGRTNPQTDPQGQAFYEMVELAVLRYHLPANTVQKILGPWNNPQQIYSEEGLPTEIQSGGLDLGSAFLPQAIQTHMNYIALPGWLNFSVAQDSSWYSKATLRMPTGTVHGTVLAIWATTLNQSVPGALFIHYLLRHQTALVKYGYPTLQPVFQGRVGDVPALVRHA